MKPSRVPRTPATRKTPGRTNSREKIVVRDPVEVFCRIRPLPSEEEPCIKVIGATTLQLATPDSSIGHRGMYKEIQYTFKHVFDGSSTQKDVFNRVSLPLVEQLLKGRNGLLFTYGVTGSGKTYTMTGMPKDGGILPRCLDVLFNSIGGLQARKFVFKPDKLNGFEIQSDVDAMRDRQQELISNLEGPSTNTYRGGRGDGPKTPRRKVDLNWDLGMRSSETARLSVSDEDSVYAVFVTYVEIYNNCVYDLLDEPQDEQARLRPPQPPQPRIIREDGNHNMYAHGVAEVEVTSAAEAYEVFNRGMKRKTMAHTHLNAESSRSHAIFTLRLVQAPLDVDGEEVLKEKAKVTVSQLSLVDLAGSERTNRSQTRGARLREAGNINNSLLTLRTCFEVLRDNQQSGGTKMVPYRDSRLTHLFKNYFEGEGAVRMVVCVNPNPDDYDETLHVMKFAEMSQEVQVTRATPRRVDTGLTPGLTPGRRRANQVFKEALHRMEERGVCVPLSVPIDIGLVYSLGADLPSLELMTPENEELVQRLVAALENRIMNRKKLSEQYAAKATQFRANLVVLEQEHREMKQENACLRASMEAERVSRNQLEQRVVECEAQLVSARLQCESYKDENRRLGAEVDELRMHLNQRRLEQERTKQKVQDKVQAEREKVSREVKNRMMAQQQDLRSEIQRKAEKLRQVHQIVLDAEGHQPRLTRGQALAKSDADISVASTAGNTPRHAITPGPSRRGPAISNLRHRRSRSAGPGERWLDHRPGKTANAPLLELNTVLQPCMGRRKSVSKLTNPKDVTDPNTSKYCLTTQEQDSAGELETKLYKGDVLPTVGGGAQVVLTDVEVLRQTSPTSPRKRSFEELKVSSARRWARAMDLATVQDRCKTGIEGHSSSKKPRK